MRDAERQPRKIEEQFRRSRSETERCRVTFFCNRGVLSFHSGASLNHVQSDLGLRPEPDGGDVPSILPHSAARIELSTSDSLIIYSQLCPMQRGALGLSPNQHCCIVLVGLRHRARLQMCGAVLPACLLADAQVHPRSFWEQKVERHSHARLQGHSFFAKRTGSARP